MASPGLPVDVVGGVTTGHPDWHNVVHALVNEFDLDAVEAAANGGLIVRDGGLWKVLPHPSTAGKVLKSLGSTPWYEWADDITGGSGPSINTEVQHVHDGSGSDANSGYAFGAAKKTIEAAVGDLPASGGEVLVAPGVYSDVFTVTKENVTINGLGIGSVEWDVPQNQIGCTVVGGHGFKISDIEFDGVNASTQGGAIFLNGVEDFHVERIFCGGLANSLATLVGFDSRPFVLKAQGGSTGPCHGDIIDIHMEFCYSGILLGGGGVFVQATNVVGRGNLDRDHLYVRNMARAGTADNYARIHLTNGWFAHQSPNQYAARFERESGSDQYGGSKLTSITTEPGANSAAHHYYVETDDNLFANMSLIGGGGSEGGVTNNAIAGNFVGCSNNKWTNVTRTGQGGAATPQWTGAVGSQTFRE